MLHYDRIEELKLANTTILCFLSDTFVQNKGFFRGISQSTEVIEQYGKKVFSNILDFLVTE